MRSDRDRRDRTPLGRQEFLLLGVWTAVAIVAYLYRIDVHSLWLDEVMSLNVATSSLAEQWRFFQGLPEQHPLYYALLAPWLELLGTTEVAVRSFSAVWALFSGWLLYLLARRLFGSRVAAVSLCLLLLSPFWLYYAQEARMYTLLGFLTLAAHLLYLSWREDGDGWAKAAYVGVGILGAYTHLFFLFVPAGHLAYALWESRGRISEVRGEALAAGSIYTAYLPWAWVILANMREGQAWKGIEHVLLGLPYTLFRFSVGYSEVVPTAGWKADVGRLLSDHGLVIAGVILTFGALFLVGAAAAARNGRAGRFVVAGATTPVAAMFALSLVTVIVGERYLVVVFPLFLILLALGLERLLFERRGGRHLLVGAALSFLLVFFSVKSLTAFYAEGQFGKEEWEEAASVVADRARSEDVVVFHAEFVEPSFRYYYDETGGVELGTMNAENGTAGYSEGRIWLVVSHQPTDSRCVATVESAARSGQIRILLHRTLPFGAGVELFLLEMDRPTGRSDGTRAAGQEARALLRPCSA